MLLDIIQSIFFIVFPALVMWGASNVKVLGWVGPVVLCYITGLLMANIPFLTLNGEVSMTLSEVAVPLAIPLLLLSSNFMSWLKGAKKAILSFILCVIGVTIASTLAAFVFADQVQESWKIAGMMIGVYTGGTPNMSAIGLSLDVEEEKFILLNAADIVVSGIYLIFLMTIAHKMLLKVMPAYEKTDTKEEMELETKKYTDLQPILKVKNHALSILLALAFLGISIGLSFAVSGSITVVVVMLTITTLGIVGSFINRLQSHLGTYELGEYLLLIFCLAIGSMANFEQLVSGSTTILMYMAFVMTISIIIHFVLGALFKIDADTVIITSVAGIYGPAFVGPIASVMKNKAIVVTGITTGLIGYAIGNYWGLIIAYAIKSIL